MGREKIINGFSLIEIIVAMTVFFIIFAGIASVYTVGMALETRTELSTSAEYIAQFLLEFFMAAGPHNLFIGFDNDNPPLGPLMIKNLPPPEGGYAFIENLKIQMNVDKLNYYNLTDNQLRDLFVYCSDGTNFPDGKPRYIKDKYFTSELVPNIEYFPDFFRMYGFLTLPIIQESEDDDVILAKLNSIFPDTIRFLKVEDEEDPDPNPEPKYQITINSFPPFITMGSPELKYKLTVNRTDAENPKEFLVNVTVTWKVKNNPQSYTVIGKISDY